MVAGMNNPAAQFPDALEAWLERTGTPPGRLVPAGYRRQGAWARSSPAERAAIRTTQAGEPAPPRRCRTTKGDASPDTDQEEGGTSMSGQSTQYLGTREAAAFLGLSPRTLDRYRVTGEGPVGVKD